MSSEQEGIKLTRPAGQLFFRWVDRVFINLHIILLRLYIIADVMIKTHYVKPECRLQEVQPFNYVLMGSNEGYEVDPFDPFND